MRNILKISLAIIFPLIIILTQSCKKDKEKPIRDNDGNIYTSVVIGVQVWMTENLKTTKYNDGTPITLVTDGEVWQVPYTPAYCWYDNDEANFKSDYGALYNWSAVTSGKLCPEGWHVPTDAEWTTLTNYFGGESVAGGKLKETGITHWLSANAGATNQKGFTALPGGARMDGGAFAGISSDGGWWSSTEFDTERAWGRLMYYSFSNVGRYSLQKRTGFSVRCIKDN